MSNLLIVGNDKIGRECIKALEANSLVESYTIVLDKSSSLKRIIMLILKRRIPFLACVKMFIADMKRKEVPISGEYHELYSNDDLRELLIQEKVNKVLLFRAGLVISKKTLELKIPFYNIHCATVPNYAGLGSIYRALSDSSFVQNATLHHVTSTIDGGEVIKTKEYIMDENKPYWINENLAYTTGVSLLMEYIRDSNGHK